MMLIFSHVRRVSAIIGHISHYAIYQSQLRYSIIEISKISMFLSVSLLPLLFASSFHLFRLNKVGPWMNPSPPPYTKSRESRAIMFFSL